MSEKIIRLGIPNGSLQDPTVDLFKKAGWNINIRYRNYFPTIDDTEIECMLIRPQEMAHYIGRGVIDAGIAGYDWLMEVNHPDVESVAELNYSRSTNRPVRWVLAVPEDSGIDSVKQLEGKVISTEAVGMTKSYLEANGVNAEVEFSWGATEVKPPHFADAIVELTETGSSLKANNLKIVDTLVTSTTRLAINKNIRKDEWKSSKIDTLVMMLNGVLESRSLVGLMFNANKDKLDTILKLLPAMKSPTISQLYNDEKWFAVNIVIEEAIIRTLIPQLRDAGAQDIVEYPLNKIIR